MHDFIKNHHKITNPCLHKVLTALVLMLGALGIWFGAEELWLRIWNEIVVIPYLSSISNHWILTAACIFISILVFGIAVYRFVVRYQYRLSVGCMASVLITLLVYYRFFTNLYIYESPCESGFKYVDFLLIWLGLYIIASILNLIYGKYHKEQTQITKAAKPKVKRLRLYQ